MATKATKPAASRDPLAGERRAVEVIDGRELVDGMTGETARLVHRAAEREDSRLQKMKQTTSLGVGPATLTMPSGSAQVLGVVRRETVKDPAFYDRFFSLVQSYVDQEQERAAHERRPQDERQVRSQPNQ